MLNPENFTSRVKAYAFVDYIPAELRINKEWLIVYRAKNPLTGSMDRFRMRVPVIEPKNERIKHAKKIVVGINEKLASGWSPFMEETGKNYKTFLEAVEMFLKGIDKQVKDGVLREDTKRTYNSNCNLLKVFVQVHCKITFALEINRVFCVKYLDWIYIERNSSPRTRNNHLIFIKLFCSFLVNKGMLAENPAFGLTPLAKTPKKRNPFDEQVKEKIKEYIFKMNCGFPTLCLTTYYCLLRNSELRKLRVWMVNLNNGTIFTPANISKNRKDEIITIPEVFLPILKKHLDETDNDWYVFSNNNYQPGQKQMPVRKINNTWDKLRDDLKIGNENKFYAFKDSGITDLLASGVPAFKVRNQARHSSVEITEIYTPRMKEADTDIRNSNVKF